MIIRMSDRGYSFKGAGAYFLHDKKADTQERIEWFETLNTVSNDPKLALKEMAWTSQNSQAIKQIYGGSLAGAKPTGKNVLPFSLSWHPEQQPSQEDMKAAMLEALKVQGLEKHQVVLVAHNDTDHKHVHAIVNLVNPETGRINQMQMGKREFSKWAQEYEEKQGKIYCQQRVENNQLRKENELKPEHEKLNVRYKEKAVQGQGQIREAYENTNDLQSFTDAIKEQGYSLAQGRKGRMVLVDREGNISNLVRQLEGVKTKDVREKFSGIENGVLEQAEFIQKRIRDNAAYEKKKEKDRTGGQEAEVFDRDAYETQWQKDLVDAGIQADNKKRRIKGNIEKTHLKKTSLEIHPESFAKELDMKRQEELKQEQLYSNKKRELNKFYNRDNYVARIDELRRKIIQTKTKSGREKLQQEFINLQKTLKNIDKRLYEQGVQPNDNINKFNDVIKEQDNNQNQKDSDNIPIWKKGKSSPEQEHGLDL